MGALYHLSARPALRATVLMLALLATLALGALTTVAPWAIAALGLAGTLAVLLLALPPRAAVRAARPAPTPTGEAAPALRLVLADGSTRVAQPVDLPGHDEHRLLLTRDGYVLVDAAGKVLHRL